jgi:peptidoglycan hydrolase CwlO-like protein
MNRLSLILRILAVVGAVATAAIFFVSKGKLAEKEAALQTAQKTTQATQAELTAANEKIESLESRLNNEREALSNSKRKVESVRSEMYTARQELSRTQQQLAEAKKTINNLENTAQRLRADLVKTERSLVAANKEGEIAQFNERIAELEELNADLKESLEDARVRAMTTRSAGTKGKLATGPVGFGTGLRSGSSEALPTASVSIGPETTIRSISTDKGLIALSNAPDLGLSPGLEVRLVRNLKVIGQIKFIQITDQVAIANILPGSKTHEMVAGGTVNLLR